MKYVIDLDELTKWQIENDTLPIVPFVKNFLKSKTPVEEIDDIKVRQAINWVKNLGEEKYKIYIEVIK